MQIDHVSVSFQRTVSLPGYANFKVGITLSATIEPEESDELVINKLYRRAHFLVDHQVRKDEQKYREDDNPELVCCTCGSDNIWHEQGSAGYYCANASCDDFEKTKARASFC